MTYKILIQETIERVEEVEADSPEDARQHIEDLYRSSEIVLTADNATVDYKIKIL